MLGRVRALRLRPHSALLLLLPKPLHSRLPITLLPVPPGLMMLVPALMLVLVLAGLVGCTRSSRCARVLFRES